VTTEVEFTPKRWAIGGRRIDLNGSLVFHIFKMDDERYYEISTASVFDWNPKSMRKLAVGGVYTIQTNPEGSSVRLSGAIFEKMLADAEKRQEWSARDRAALAAVERVKMAAKVKKTDADLARVKLGDLRAMWLAERNSASRLGLELVVLAALRGHG
jgi:hypothetical protein